VVHLITRRVPDAGRVSLDARAGTDETYQGNAFGSARGDRAGFSLNANWLETGGYLEVAPGQRGPIDAENASENASLQARVEADLGARTTALLRGNWFDQDQDRDTVLSHTETRVWDAAAGVETLLDPRNALHFDLYFLDERFATDNISTIPFDSRDAEFVSNAHVTPSEDRGGSARWTRSTDSALASFSLGVDYRAVEGFDDAEIFLADGSLFQTKVGSGEQESIGLYAEASIAPADDLELLASLRHDSFDNRNGRDVTDGVVTRFPDKEFDDLNPRLAVRWQATAEVALRGAVYTGFRAPTLAELYRAFGTSSFQGLPNSQLDPETLAGAELGLDVAAGSFFGQVNAFHNEVEDFIGGVAVAFDPIFTLQNFNIGQIETEGVELIGELRLAGGWSVGGSYTYTDAVITENIDDPTVIGNRVEGAPETTAALRVGYARPEGLAATVRGRYVDEQFQDSTNTARLPAHTVVDLYLAHPVGRRAEVYATAENLFDEEYLAGAFGGLESLGAPRQISGGVRLRLD
jgi:outer membrane receptor protein involved in Fe transport